MPGKEIKSEREFDRLIKDEHENGRLLAALFYNPNDDPDGNDYNSIKAKFKAWEDSCEGVGMCQINIEGPNNGWAAQWIEWRIGDGTRLAIIDGPEEGHYVSKVFTRHEFWALRYSFGKSPCPRSSLPTP